MVIFSIKKAIKGEGEWVTRGLPNIYHLKIYNIIFFFNK